MAYSPAAASVPPRAPPRDDAPHSTFHMLAHARQVVLHTLSPDSVAPEVTDPVVVAPLNPWHQSRISLRSSSSGSTPSRTGYGGSHSRSRRDVPVLSRRSAAHSVFSSSGGGGTSGTSSYSASSRSSSWLSGSPPTSRYTTPRHARATERHSASRRLTMSAIQPSPSPAARTHRITATARTEALAHNIPRAQVGARLQRFAAAEEQQAVELQALKQSIEETRDLVRWCCSGGTGGCCGWACEWVMRCGVLTHLGPLACVYDPATQGPCVLFHVFDDKPTLTWLFHQQ